MTFHKHVARVLAQEIALLRALGCHTCVHNFVINTYIYIYYKHCLNCVFRIWSLENDGISV